MILYRGGGVVVRRGTSPKGRRVVDVIDRRGHSVRIAAGRFLAMVDELLEHPDLLACRRCGIVESEHRGMTIGGHDFAPGWLE